MIIQQITKFLLYILGRLTAVFTTIITMPIVRLVNLLMPDEFNNYGLYLTTFLDDHLIPGLAFAREVFFNVTGYPRTLFAALVLIFTGKLALRISLIAFRFIIKVYYVLRGSSANS